MGNGSLFSHFSRYEISVKLVLNKYYKQTVHEPGFNLKALQPPELYPHLLHDTSLIVCTCSFTYTCNVTRFLSLQEFLPKLFNLKHAFRDRIIMQQ